LAAFGPTLKWYEKPTILRIIPIALCNRVFDDGKVLRRNWSRLRAFIFLVKFIKDIRNYKNTCCSLLYSASSVFLGMWWSVYNYIKWICRLGM
jgi:hypothetical protein